MAYNEEIASRLRQSLTGTKNLEEKKMFGGIAFMINDKMCIGVSKDEIILKYQPEDEEKLLSKKYARPFDMTGKPMKGWLYVSKEGISNKKDFDFWLNTALEANKNMAAAKSKKAKK